MLAKVLFFIVAVVALIGIVSFNGALLNYPNDFVFMLGVVNYAVCALAFGSLLYFLLYKQIIQPFIKSMEDNQHGKQ